MYRELCLYNNQHLDTEQKIQGVFEAIAYEFNGVSIALPILRHVQSYIPETGMVFAVPIDYPSGESDLRVRQHAAIVALKSGANAIDLVPSKYLIKDRKTIELAQDIKAHVQICKDYGASLRVFMDYNHLEDEQVVTLGKIYKDLGVDYIIPSLGYHNDDIVDNLIISQIIKDACKLDVICNGHIWLPKHLNKIEDSKVFGLRLYSLQIFKQKSV